MEPLPRQALKQSRDHTTLTCFLKQAKYSIKTITKQSLMFWTLKPQKPKVHKGKNPTFGYYTKNDRIDQPP